MMILICAKLAPLPLGFLFFIAGASTMSGKGLNKNLSSFSSRRGAKVGRLFGTGGGRKSGYSSCSSSISPTLDTEEEEVHVLRRRRR